MCVGERPTCSGTAKVVSDTEEKRARISVTQPGGRSFDFPRVDTVLLQRPANLRRRDRFPASRERPKTCFLGNVRSSGTPVAPLRPDRHQAGTSGCSTSLR